MCIYILPILFEIQWYMVSVGLIQFWRRTTVSFGADSRKLSRAAT